MLWGSHTHTHTHTHTYMNALDITQSNWKKPPACRPVLVGALGDPAVAELAVDEEQHHPRANVKDHPEVVRPAARELRRAGRVCIPRNSRQPLHAHIFHTRVVNQKESPVLVGNSGSASKIPPAV
eukprot:COSAG06_NODE_694_length_13019_cov_11.782043_1_plen_125_part_00